MQEGIDALVEFMFETVRTVVSLLYSGTLEQSCGRLAARWQPYCASSRPNAGPRVPAEPVWQAAMRAPLSLRAAWSTSTGTPRWRAVTSAASSVPWTVRSPGWVARRDPTWPDEPSANP